MLVIISCESSWQYQSFSQKSFLVFRSRCIQSKIGRLLSFSYFRLTTFIKYFNQYVVSSLAKVWHSLSLILHRVKIERKLKIAIQVAIKFLFYFLSFEPWSIYTSKECEFKFTIWPVWLYAWIVFVNSDDGLSFFLIFESNKTYHILRIPKRRFQKFPFFSR